MLWPCCSREGEQMDSYLRLTAEESKPVEIWDLFTLTQETFVGEQELNPVHFFCGDRELRI